MRRLPIAIMVGLLTFTASGVSSLVFSEPCTAYESPGPDDGACSPTCVTCGCCAQPVEPVVVAVTSSPDAPLADLTAFLPGLPRTDPRDILHVPKPRVS